MNQSDGGFDIFVLDGARFGANDWPSTTQYGNFHITGRGYFAQPRDFYTHSEMAALPDLIRDEQGNINIRYNAVDSSSSDLFLERISITNTETGPGYPTVGLPCNARTESNMYAVAAGSDPYFDNLRNGSTTQIAWYHTREAGREVYMTRHLVYQQDYAHTKRNKWWKVDRIEINSWVNVLRAKRSTNTIAILTADLRLSTSSKPTTSVSKIRTKRQRACGKNTAVLRFHITEI